MTDDEPYRLCICPNCSHPKFHAADSFFKCYACGANTPMESVAVEIIKSRDDAVQRKDYLMGKYKDVEIQRRIDARIAEQKELENIDESTIQEL